MDDILKTLIPEEWMRQQFEKELTKEELDKINDLGGLENLMREFKRLEEQEKEHHGGNKWVGTAGASPFGNAGQHPNGMKLVANLIREWQQKSGKKEILKILMTHCNLALET